MPWAWAARLLANDIGSWQSRKISPHHFVEDSVRGWGLVTCTKTSSKQIGIGIRYTFEKRPQGLVP